VITLLAMRLSPSRFRGKANVVPRCSPMASVVRGKRYVVNRFRAATRIVPRGRRAKCFLLACHLHGAYSIAKYKTNGG
jgi:hypothetical protein